MSLILLFTTKFTSEGGAVAGHSGQIYFSY